MVGGVAALSGAYFLGPRLGRFHQKLDGTWETKDIPGHNTVLAATGVFILFFGFFPFNGASGYNIAAADVGAGRPTGADTTGRVVVVTLLAGAAGGLTMLGAGKLHLKHWDLPFAMNGVLAGMVSVCAGANYFDPWAAVVVGVSAQGIFFGLSRLLERFRIDDPLEAAPLHFGAGMWGLIMVGFFANPEYMRDHCGWADCDAAAACAYKLGGDRFGCLQKCAQDTTQGHCARGGVFFGGDGTTLGPPSTFCGNTVVVAVG